MNASRNNSRDARHVLPHVVQSSPCEPSSDLHTSSIAANHSDERTARKRLARHADVRAEE